MAGMGIVSRLLLEELIQVDKDSENHEVSVTTASRSLASRLD